jgi:hypothetical protein
MQRPCPADALNQDAAGDLARALAADLGLGEWLGINPWSGHELKLPPRVE